ncbi:MAG: hypothetical protein FJW34_14280 [Acidobacteria bacterium]|nr:hypothetical protein [Acidobacteriota bacterium]
MNGIVDFHAHLGKAIHGYPPLTVEKLLRFMAARDIEWSVVLPLVHPEEEHYYYTTEQALADCARHPDRLIPFANIDPRRSPNDGHYDFVNGYMEGFVTIALIRDMGLPADVERAVFRGNAERMLKL